MVDSTVYSVAMTTRTKYAPLRHGVVTLGLVASALIGIGGSVDAAPRIYPLDVIQTTVPDVFGVRASTSGTTVVAFDGFDGVEHINVLTASPPR